MQMLENSAPQDALHTIKLPAHQSVYQQLRGQILFGNLAPGQAITIQGIVEQLNAGMTPVREAIRRLTSEGALVMQGNRRVLVPELTENCVEQLDFMRKALEPKLVRLAVDRVSDSSLDLLRSEDASLNAAITQGNIQAYLTHNYRFHAALYAQANAPIMTATVDRLWLRFGPSLRVVCGRYGTLNLPDKHADLLQALAQRDHDTAALAVLEDIDQGMLQIREALTGNFAAD